MSYSELVFLIPLITSIGWFLVTNLLGLMDGDADSDLEMETEIEAEADVDMEVEADADAEIEGEVSGGLSWLGFLGFKKVPFILWLQILGLIWGTVGLALMVWIDSVLIRMVISGVATVFGTGSICAVLAKVMPKTESDLVTDYEMLGTTGVVTTSKVTATFGQALFTGKMGYITREVRTQEEAGPLAKNEVVIVIGDKDGALIVQREADLLIN